MLPSVNLELSDRMHELRYSMKSVRAINEKIGTNALTEGLERLTDAEVLVAYVWAGLAAEKDAPDFETTAELFGPSDFERVVDAVFTAFTGDDRETRERKAKEAAATLPLAPAAPAAS